jgi:sec-independent protein translocase protein TatC
MADLAADQTEEEGLDDSKAPLLEHLIELRQRLIYSAAAILVLFFACYYFAPQIYGFLVQPLADVLATSGGNQRLIFTALHEAFFTYIKVAFFAAIFVAFPFISIQLWMFIAPGLYKHEKMALLPFLVAAPVLFFMGGALVYYWVFPVAWEFLLSFQQDELAGSLSMELEAKVDQYLSLVMQLIFAFGLCFELPVVMTLLAKTGLVGSRGMRDKRKYAIVAAFVAAAVLTPPDPFSQIGLALPVILLYEVSILAVRLIEKQRGDDLEDEDDDDPLEETDFNDT